MCYSGYPRDVKLLAIDLAVDAKLSLFTLFVLRLNWNKIVLDKFKKDEGPS